MRSNFAKSLFATLVLMCAVTTGTASDVQAFHERAKPAQFQALQSSTGVNSVHVMAATSAQSDSATKHDATLMVATSPVASDFAFEAATRHRDFSGRGAPVQVKSWMLVLIGIFLILAISHRRYRSMVD